MWVFSQSRHQTPQLSSFYYQPWLLSFWIQRLWKHYFTIIIQSLVDMFPFYIPHPRYPSLSSYAFQQFLPSHCPCQSDLLTMPLFAFVRKFSWLLIQDDHHLLIIPLHHLKYQVAHQYHPLFVLFKGLQSQKSQILVRVPLGFSLYSLYLGVLVLFSLSHPALRLHALRSSPLLHYLKGPVPTILLYLVLKAFSH